MAVVFPKLKIAYFPVPKVASTTVKNALYEFEHGRAFSHTNHDGRHIHTVHPATRVTDRDMREHAERLRGYWKFTIVRDPARRLVSAYKNRVLHHRDLEKARHARLRSIAFGIPLEPTLREFLSLLPRYRLAFHQMRHHTAPFETFIGSDLSFFDAVFRIEDIGALEAALGERLGQPVSLGRTQTGGPSIPLESIDDEEWALLMSRARKDYRLLADHYRPPVRQPAAAARSARG